MKTLIRTLSVAVEGWDARSRNAQSANGLREMASTLLFGIWDFFGVWVLGFEISI
jgi:hypothetical protein